MGCCASASAADGAATERTALRATGNSGVVVGASSSSASASGAAAASAAHAAHAPGEAARPLPIATVPISLAAPHAPMSAAHSFATPGVNARTSSPVITPLASSDEELPMFDRLRIPRATATGLLVPSVRTKLEAAYDEEYDMDDEAPEHRIATRDVRAYFGGMEAFRRDLVRAIQDGGWAIERAETRRNIGDDELRVVAVNRHFERRVRLVALGSEDLVGLIVFDVNPLAPAHTPIGKSLSSSLVSSSYRAARLS